MARSKALKAESTGTDIALVDDALSNEIANIRSQISQPSGNRLKLAATGHFSLPDGTDLGDEFQAVIVDFLSVNRFYSGPYNPNDISPPDCVAFSPLASANDPNGIYAMEPMPESPNIQNDGGPCRTCPLNQFGSGNNGKGKACQNRRLVALLVIDPDNPDAHNEPDAPIYVLDLSPSNNKPLDAVVGNIARSLNGPALKAIVTISARNVGTYAAVNIGHPIPNPDYALHFQRRAEAADILQRKPDFSAALAAPSARGNARQPARRIAGGRR
jgi:hypothetical protein